MSEDAHGSDNGHLSLRAQRRVNKGIQTAAMRERQKAAAMRYDNGLLARMAIAPLEFNEDGTIKTKETA